MHSSDKSLRCRVQFDEVFPSLTRAKNDDVRIQVAWLTPYARYQHTVVTQRGNEFSDSRPAAEDYRSNGLDAIQ